MSELAPLSTQQLDKLALDALDAMRKMDLIATFLLDRDQDTAIRAKQSADNAMTVGLRLMSAAKVADAVVNTERKT